MLNEFETKAGTEKSSQENRGQKNKYVEEERNKQQIHDAKLFHSFIHSFIFGPPHPLSIYLALPCPRYRHAPLCIHYLFL